MVWGNLSKLRQATSLCGFEKQCCEIGNLKGGCGSQRSAEEGKWRTSYVEASVMKIAAPQARKA